MTCLENIELFFNLWISHDKQKKCATFYGDRHSELFPYKDETQESYRLLYYGQEYKNINESNFKTRQIDIIIDELYMLHEMSEEIYAHGVCNFTQKIHLFPKNKKILCTNFSQHMYEMYDYIIKDGYSLYSFDEFVDVFLNKKVLIKKLYFEEKCCIPGARICKDDFTHLHNIIKKDNLVIFRGDAIHGVYRKLTNVEDVKKLFEKYNFVIKNGMANLTFYEKKLYFNNFKNIFLESGGGNCNAFLVEKNKDVTIYTLESASMGNEFYFNNLPVNVKFLDIGYLDKESPLYGVYYKGCGDPLNEPWKIDLDKLENLLKTLT